MLGVLYFVVLVCFFSAAWNFNSELLFTVIFFPTPPSFAEITKHFAALTVDPRKKWSSPGSSYHDLFFKGLLCWLS
ncbi:hypothetical protein AHAS_Ahas20G0303000 [Arachis hypogaea]